MASSRPLSGGRFQHDIVESGEVPGVFRILAEQSHERVGGFDLKDGAPLTADHRLGTHSRTQSRGRLDRQPAASHITFMALARKKATTIALDPEYDRLLTRAARERGVSRSEFIRQQLALVLEQYRRHPKPRSAGAVRSLRERGDEGELFGGRRG